MTTLDSNLIIWRLEYFALHRLAVENGISVKHNNNVGDIASVRRLLYSLVRKILVELLITPIDINGSPPKDLLSKSHGDLSFELLLDPAIMTTLTSLMTQLRTDADMLTLIEILDEFASNGISLIRVDRTYNRISFNVGKTCRRGRDYQTAPNAVAFFEQLLVFAPVWQRLRCKIQKTFEQSDIARQLNHNHTADLNGSPLEKFKTMIANRKQLRNRQ